MRLRQVLPLAAVVALAACGSADKPASPEQVRKEAAKVNKPEPGLYRSSVKTVAFEVPGMPPAQADRLKQMFSQTEQAHEYCLTAEEAARGMEAAAKKMAQGNCTYQRFAATGTAIDAQMTCETGQGMVARIAMQGAMTRDSSQMTMTIEQSMPGKAAGSVKMKSEVKSQRIGACPGEAK